ncbi:hypothetical protein A0H81_07085 [Grifola frondosa]|uniref:SAP domain-containing protein n=1 Tax=Grifola frondosa TaxID=5627 RepID=A0A1C7M7L8_GRIFR|nr:hypothetical protein A0H81_07085 [Grifola frondosa]
MNNSPNNPPSDPPASASTFPTTSKWSTMPSQMPWEQLKAETVRAIYKDLGLSKYTGRRDDMIQHLQEMETDGLDAVVERLEGIDANEEPASAQEPRVKRKRPTAQVAPSGSSRRRKSLAVSENAPAARPISSGGKFDGVLVPTPPKQQCVVGGPVAGEVFMGVMLSPAKRVMMRWTLDDGARENEDKEDADGEQQAVKGKSKSGRSGGALDEDNLRTT